MLTWLVGSVHFVSNLIYLAVWRLESRLLHSFGWNKTKLKLSSWSLWLSRASVGPCDQTCPPPINTPALPILVLYPLPSTLYLLAPLTCSELTCLWLTSFTELQIIITQQVGKILSVACWCAVAVDLWQAVASRDKISDRSEASSQPGGCKVARPGPQSHLALGLELNKDGKEVKRDARVDGRRPSTFHLPVLEKVCSYYKWLLMWHPGYH